MKQVLFVIMFCLGSILSNAQLFITGYIFDENEQPHAYANVSLVGADIKLSGQTNEHGRFEFRNLKIGQYEFQVITAYGLIRRDFKLTKSFETVITVPRAVKMDEVTVRASRVSSDMPFAFENVERAQIELKNLGQDVPYLLKWTQSAVVTSDAGTGIGYTGMRIRGSDPTRTNVTINGIPLNDAESQAVFWVDLPDFLSSAESIQIQRGVGTSVNGAGAFGASINLNTSKLNQKAYAEIASSAGSFGTIKGNVKFGSGLLNNRWTLDGRVSRIRSDGYIDRAEANLWSGFGSLGFYGNYSSLKFNLFHGEEVTYQAWNGVPAQYIDDLELRKTNTAGAERPGTPYDNEVDDYKQTHYQVLYNTQFAPFLRVNAAAHYTRGKGFFEQYKAQQNLSEYLFNSDVETDLIRRRWLDNHFFGGLANINLKGNKDGIIVDVGMAYHRYLGRHFGEVIWNSANVPQDGLQNYYDNEAIKGDFNMYAKIQSAIINDKLRGFIDLQQRNVCYEFVGIAADGSALPQLVKHQFFNPKAGLTLRTQENKGQIYASIAVAQKEPNRDDYTESTINNSPRSEKLVDVELGYRYTGERISYGLNIYNMKYKDQIVPTGQLNDVGAYIRENVDESYRRGIELSAMYAISKRLDFKGNATISQNKISSFTEFIDDWDNGNQFTRTYEKVDLAFSPRFIGALELEYDFIKKEKIDGSLTLSGKWVGDQFLDNTGNQLAKLDNYFYSDLGIQGTTILKGGQMIRVTVLFRNILNQLYSSNGWVYRFKSADYDPRADDPFVLSNGGNEYNTIGYYPQATRNILVGLTFTF